MRFSLKQRRAASANRPDPLSYAEAGVDIAAGEEAVERIRDRVRKTFRPEVIGDIGGFGGLFAFDAKKYANPVLVSTTDGVGTKLIIARLMNRHDTVGRDLVAMCVDDLVCSGAEPLFFLDYVSMSPLNPELIGEIIEGIVEGCREAHCALVGGEMAEHPGMIEPGGYDLVGCAVGVAERDKLITGESIAPGDVIVGIESGGLMSNGFSLARMVLFERAGLSVGDRLPAMSHSVGEELLRPTPIYAPALLSLIEHVEVKGLVHVTGGGIPGNLLRVLPPKTEAVIDLSRWEPDPIFGAIARLGHVPAEEMYRVFNMGLGMLAVVDADDAFDAIDHLRARGHHAHEVGEIRKGKHRVTLDQMPEIEETSPADE